MHPWTTRQLFRDYCRIAHCYARGHVWTGLSHSVLSYSQPFERVLDRETWNGLWGALWRIWYLRRLHAFCFRGIAESVWVPHNAERGLSGTSGIDGSFDTPVQKPSASHQPSKRNEDGLDNRQEAFVLGLRHR